jgi:glycosyltransferase involved in cell wall biosynthesis
VAPLISVVVAVRDGARWLAEAVTSVLAEDVPLELFVVDDASTDDTRAVLASVRDPRLVAVLLDAPVGPFGAANVALARARGPFIARLDADDRNRRGRLAAQLAFLEANAAVGLVGSACTLIDEAGRALGVQAVPQSDAELRARMLVGPPFVHSSVMWRAALQLRYDDALTVGGDYALWGRALAATEGRNLPEPWVDYRRWDGSWSARAKDAQRAVHDGVALAWLRRTRPELGAGAHVKLRRWLESGGAAAAELEAWIAKLGDGPALRRPLGTWGQP